METLTTIDEKINVSKEMKTLKVGENLELPLKRRYYVAILATKFKYEIEREFTTRRVDDKVVITRVK